MAKAKIDRPRKLKSGDYILEEHSGWFELGGVVVRLYVNWMDAPGKVVAEIFPIDCDMDDDKLLAACSVEAR